MFDVADVAVGLDSDGLVVDDVAGPLVDDDSDPEWSQLGLKR